jgi:hypothetical protein
LVNDYQSGPKIKKDLIKKSSSKYGITSISPSPRVDEDTLISVDS